jgi:negative regulator of flagellin synthesis FlgM
LKIDQTTGSATPFRLTPRATKAAAPEAERLEQQGNVRQLSSPADGTFDAARVARIREDIRAGRYQVNPERIADAMLNSLGTLLPGVHQ